MGARFWSWMPNSILGITFACLLLPGLSAATHGEADPSANDRQEWGKFEVGFSTIRLNLEGSRGEARALDLLGWYPTDAKSYRSSVSRAYYKRRLYGVALDPSWWNSLSWHIHAERARSGLVIDATGSSFPLLIFSPALSASVLDGITQELVIRLREKSSLTSKALQITNSTKAIIHWQSFLIGTCEITRFLQQSASSAVLSSA